jgi:hypothetical protein
MTTATPTNRVGLRFPRSAQRVLRNIAESYRGVEGVDVGLFEKAADSVRDGVPLDVVFAHRSEVEQMVAAFRRLGVPEPKIEDQHANY